MEKSVFLTSWLRNQKKSLYYFDLPSYTFTDKYRWRCIIAWTYVLYRTKLSNYSNSNQAAQFYQLMVSLQDQIICTNWPVYSNSHEQIYLCKAKLKVWAIVKIKCIFQKICIRLVQLYERKNDVWAKQMRTTAYKQTHVFW